MSGFLGAGDLYVDRQNDSGASTGLIQIGNATSFGITESSEIKERKSRMKSTYGQVLDSVPIKQPATISLTVDELNMDNLALALLGENAVLTQAAQTDTAVTVTAKLDKWAPIGYKAITAVAAADSQATALVEGADYELNATAGLIKFLSTSTHVVEDEAINLTISADAVDGRKVTGSVKPTIKAKLFLDGKNFADGKQVHVTVLEAVLTPSEGEVNFLSEEFTTLSLSGTLNTPTGETAPYFVEYF